MYCQNCGAKMANDTKYCPFCGYSNEDASEIDEKDLKIKDLQEKITQLEQTVSNSGNFETERGFNNNKMFILIFVFPLAFLVLFFVLFIILTQ